MAAPTATCKTCQRPLVQYVLWGLAKWFHVTPIHGEDYHQGEAA
jgi:hypothetical protein